MNDQTQQGRPSLRLICCPSQHWSGRGVTDKNATLWCSWVSKTENCTYFYAGGTGYCGGMFRTIGELYGPMDIACLPIGNYGCKPERWFHEHNHMDPEEAVQCHWDLQSRQSIGVRWGTFSFTGESVMEPLERLEKAMEGKLLPLDTFACLNHGETRIFNTVGSGPDSPADVCLSPMTPRGNLKSGLSRSPNRSPNSSKQVSRNSSFEQLPVLQLPRGERSYDRLAELRNAPRPTPR